MKKLFILTIVLIFIFLLGLTACGNADVAQIYDEAYVATGQLPGQTPAGADHNFNGAYATILLMDAYISLTSGDFAGASALFQMYINQADVPNIAAVAGLGRAHFNAGNYSDAETAFLRALEIEPDRTDFLHYLGDAQMRIGNYANAAANFQRILDNRHNAVVFRKAETALRRAGDFNALFHLFDRRIEALDVQYPGAFSQYIAGLVEAAQLRQEAGLLASVVDRFIDYDIGFALKTGYEAHRLLMAGDEQAAKEMLFNLEIIQDLTGQLWQRGIYFGGFNTYGEYDGPGFLIGGHNIWGQIYFGQFQNGKPHGPGTGLSGHAGVWGSSSQMIQADWQNGIPGGFVVQTSDWSSADGSGNRRIESAFYADGLAQGEVIAEQHSFGGEWGDHLHITKHYVVDGIPTPFEVETRWDGTVMVYEAFFDNLDDLARGFAQWTQESFCRCFFGF